MNKILLIDDDERLLPPMQAFFARHGMQLDGAQHPVDGLEKLAGGDYELLILDVMLPEMDGFEVLRELRKRSSLPVVMLTARGDVMDRVVGLELGADDYLPKPFEPRELVARVQNILKRATPVQDQAASRLHFEHLEIDPTSREVLLDDQAIQLTGTEYELLFLLASKPGVNLSRDDIINAMKGVEAELFTRSVDIAVSRIRNKLKPHDFIRTVRGVGYAFTGKPVR
jgi:OmpR family response regulator RpaB